jgi:hypothetical protein
LPWRICSRRWPRRHEASRRPLVEHWRGVFSTTTLVFFATAAGARGVARGFGRIGFVLHGWFGRFGLRIENCVKFCKAGLGEIPFLIGKQEDGGAEDHRGGGFGVVENLFEFVEGFDLERQEAVADGEGVFLFGDGERLLEGGVVAPAVDGGPGDGGELGSRGHGGACGEGLKNRDLSRGKGFHAWFHYNSFYFYFQNFATIIFLKYTLLGPNRTKDIFERRDPNGLTHFFSRR